MSRYRAGPRAMNSVFERLRDDLAPATLLADVQRAWPDVVGARARPPRRTGSACVAGRGRRCDRSRGDPRFRAPRCRHGVVFRLGLGAGAGPHGTGDPGAVERPPRGASDRATALRGGMIRPTRPTWPAGPRHASFWRGIETPLRDFVIRAPPQTFFCTFAGKSSVLGGGLRGSPVLFLRVPASDAPARCQLRGTGASQRHRRIVGE